MKQFNMSMQKVNDGQTTLFGSVHVQDEGVAARVLMLAYLVYQWDDPCGHRVSADSV